MTEIRLKPRALEWREIDGEMIVLEAERSLYLAANPAATLLWRRLADGATREQLRDALVDAFAIDAGLAARDVDAFIEQARELRVLEGP
jgi:Coenzyme PQQ synthesis protein D (PqqD)